MQFPAWAPVKRERIYPPGRGSCAEQDYKLHFLAAGAWRRVAGAQHPLRDLYFVAQEKHLKIKAFVSFPLPAPCLFPRGWVTLRVVTL